MKKCIFVDGFTKLAPTGGAVKVALAVATFAGLQLSAEAALTAKSYITDGIIGHWDGIENVSYGGVRDESVDTWTDLVDGSLNITLPTDSSFATDATGLTTVRAYGTKTTEAVWKASAEYTAFKAANYTVEVAYRQDEAISTGSGYAYRLTFLSFGHDKYWFGTRANNWFGFKGSFGISENLPEMYLAVKANGTLGKHTHSCSHGDGIAKIIVDGDTTKAVTEEKTGADSPTTSKGFCFNMPGTYENNGLPGCYYAIRFYKRVLTDDERVVNNAVDAVRFFGKDSSAVALPTGWRWSGSGGAADVALEHQCAYSVEPAGAGLVSVDGETPAASGSFWVEQGVGVAKTLVATANEGYAFVGWTGEGLTAEQKVSPTITATLVGSVTAVFRKTDGSDPRTYTWQGGVWDDRMAWRDEDGIPGSPLANDSVIIPAGKTALLTNSTPKYAALTVSGTLACSNWLTCVQADAVTVANGGKMTVAGLSTDAQTNRVWVACTDCTIATGGSIDVDDLGFRGSADTRSGGSETYVAGPGKAIALTHGASHGGHGAFINCHGMDKVKFQNVLPYDNARKPMLPGSGGYPQVWGAGTAGGGAVYLSAKKSVTVNGKIKASVTKTVASRGSCGSGGAVLIECETFHGTNGTISADGGGSTATADKIVSDPNGGAAGGGGMIAIVYDPEQQTEDMISDMTISAAAGLYDSKQAFGDESDRFEAGLGTLYFPDNKLLRDTFGRGLYGALVNVGSYIHQGDLTFAKGHLRLATEGAKLKVNGKLSISGAMTRLEIGGVTITNQCTVAGIWAGLQTNILEVAGDLAIENKGTLDLRAAETNDTMAIGAYLKVGGQLSIATNSTLYCWSDQVNMGSPFIEADSLLIDAGGMISGYMRGCGPGKGLGGGIYSSGGSHGGQSGRGTNNKTRRQPYDDELLPTMPGSGGGNGSWAAGGMGGGVVHLSVSRSATVNGTINVDGMRAYGSHTGGGGAGGTINIRSKNFTSGENAVLTAKGANGLSYYTVSGGSGGSGGRVAIWCGEQRDPTALRTHYREFIDPEAHPEFFSCSTNCISVNGGYGISTASTHPETDPDTIADDGTIRFVYVWQNYGCQIFVR